MSADRVAIATVSDRGYLPAACCQLKSAWDHLANRRNVRFCLVLCDVGSDDRREAERFFRARGVDAEVLVPETVAARIRPISPRWPRAAYLRLYFDSLFGTDIARLIYFDADTRVCAPLDPLLSTALHGAPVGAVHDFIYYVTGNIRRRRRDLFLASDAPYLQSGVMVFDWPATLADGGLERARQFLQSHPERCQEAPDQDALNAAFEGRWTPIDPRWNLHELYLMFGGRLIPYVEHYTSTKPWSRRRPAAWQNAAAWYARELADTAWANFIPPQTAMDAFLARTAFLRFRYAPRVRDIMAAHAPVVLDLLGKPRMRSDEEELPWAPRSRKDVEDMAQALIAEAERRCPRLLPPEAVLPHAIT
ncbi:MAG: glycosyltransferase family 8 protein [Hyphomicrobiaceae bacterium]|jgi:lipopolysaccharide biosynthesis glycosyltransferase